jgi:hypothetical protein
MDEATSTRRLGGSMALEGLGHVNVGAEKAAAVSFEAQSGPLGLRYGERPANRLLPEASKRASNGLARRVDA